MKTLILGRHGNTNKQTEGQTDKERQLSDKGYRQAEDRAASADYSNIDLVLSSSAPRAYMTAQIVTRTPLVEILKYDELYPAPVGYGEEFDRLFNELGYESAATYIKAKGGGCVLAWAEEAWDAIKRRVNGVGNDKSVAIFGHAVCLPAIAMVMLQNYPELVEKLSHIQMSECGIIQINFDETGVPLDEIIVLN